MPILCLKNQFDPRGSVFQPSLKASHLQTHSKGQFKIWFLHYHPYSFSDRLNAPDMKIVTATHLALSISAAVLDSWLSPVWRAKFFFQQGPEDLWNLFWNGNSTIPKFSKKKYMSEGIFFWVDHKCFTEVSLFFFNNIINIVKSHKATVR